MIYSFLVFNKMGRVYMEKWYTEEWTRKTQRRIRTLVIDARTRNKTFRDIESHRVVTRRFASVYFSMVADEDENWFQLEELLVRFVKYVNKTTVDGVCEVDFAFRSCFYMSLLEQFVLGGTIAVYDTRPNVPAFNELYVDTLYSCKGVAWDCMRSKDDPC